jgi:ATP diphosphatase
MASTYNLDDLLAIMRRLRDPERGCPWDVQQSFQSIAAYTIEEAYEVADAIDRGDRAALREELGDLLLQVVFHAQMAAEEGAFSFADIVQSISAKMVRRHPHVFGDANIADADAQTRAWEAMKRAERGDGDGSALAGVARGMPEWMRATKLQSRAAAQGFDWPDARPVIAKLREELAELEAEIEAASGTARITDELGDVLFVACNLARKLKIDVSTALRATNAKFERRFRYMERLARDRGLDLSSIALDEQEALWSEARMADHCGRLGVTAGQ